MIDLLWLAWKGITRRRLRSWLTVLGIVIGVAAVVALLSISWGMEATVREQFEKFGTNKIIVMPGSMEAGLFSSLLGKPLTDEDLRAIENLPEVDFAVGVETESLPVVFRGEKKILPVYGVPVKNFKRIFENVQGYELESGTYLKPGDKYKTIVGYAVAHKIFSHEIHPGSKIIIKDKEFKVVGLIEQVGNKLDDSSILIPIEAFEELTGKKNQYMTIFVQLKNGEDADAVAEKITRRLKRLRGTEDFSVLTPTQLLQRVQTILGIIGLVLVGIAAVSLVVGGIGVMNTMYMSVVERTREIGIMKAVGATPNQIMLVFLFEAAFLGLVGGVIGTILGSFAALAVEAAARASGYLSFSAALTPQLIAFSLLFSMAVGVISGALPARMAAKLNPVEALRYE